MKSQSKLSDFFCFSSYPLEKNWLPLPAHKLSHPISLSYSYCLCHVAHFHPLSFFKYCQHVITNNQTHTRENYPERIMVRFEWWRFFLHDKCKHRFSTFLMQWQTCTWGMKIWSPVNLRIEFKDLKPGPLILVGSHLHISLVWLTFSCWLLKMHLLDMKVQAMVSWYCRISISVSCSTKLKFGLSCAWVREWIITC